MNDCFKHFSHFVNQLAELKKQMIIHKFVIRQTKPDIEDLLHIPHQEGFDR
jgi:hypothetical protein